MEQEPVKLDENKSSDNSVENPFLQEWLSSDSRTLGAGQQSSGNDKSKQSPEALGFGTLAIDHKNLKSSWENGTERKETDKSVKSKRVNIHGEIEVERENEFGDMYIETGRVPKEKFFDPRGNIKVPLEELVRGNIKEYTYKDGTKLSDLKYNEKNELTEFVGPDKQTYKYMPPKPSPIESVRNGGWKSPEMRQPMDLGKVSVNQYGIQKDGGLNPLPFKVPTRPRR